MKDGGAPDSLLIAQSLEGSKDSFSLLVDRYWKRVYAFLRKRIHNNAIAEELTQDTFLAAYKYLNTFRGDSSFYTWLCTIALNEASKTAFNSPKTDVSNVVERTPETQIESKQQLQIVDSIIKTLPVMQQKVFHLKIQEGLSYLEIGARLSCKPNYAKNLFYFALKKIREEYVKRR